MPVKLPARGHTFDDDLGCSNGGCRKTWSDQQVAPTRCKHRAPAYRTQGGRPPKIHTNSYAKIRAMLADSMSLDEVGKHYGVSRHAVSDFLIRMRRKEA